jgi:hypothetical protein
VRNLSHGEWGAGIQNYNTKLGVIVVVLQSTGLQCSQHTLTLFASKFPSNRIFMVFDTSDNAGNPKAFYLSLFLDN